MGTRGLVLGLLVLMIGLTLVGCSPERRVTRQLAGEWFDENSGERIAFVSDKEAELSDSRMVCSYRMPDENTIYFSGSPLGEFAVGIREINDDRLVLSWGFDGESESAYIRDYSQTLSAKLEVRKDEVLEGYRAALARFPSVEFLSGLIDVQGNVIALRSEEKWSEWDGRQHVERTTLILDVWDAMEPWKASTGWQSGEVTLRAKIEALEDPVPPASADGDFGGAPGRVRLEFHSEWIPIAEGQFFTTAMMNASAVHDSAQEVWLSLGQGYAAKAQVKSDPQVWYREEDPRRLWLLQTYF